MQIHELNVTGKKDRKRVGRGGKRGTTAGRGTKGQKSRSGGNVDPLFQGGRSSLIQTMKKNRGFSSPHAGQRPISLTVIDSYYADGDVVSLESLKQKKVIRNREIKSGVRLVAGNLSKKITVGSDIFTTVSAKAAIEKLGGKVEDTAPKATSKDKE